MEIHGEEMQIPGGAMQIPGGALQTPGGTMESASELVFYVNGRRMAERSPDPDGTLVQYLRDSLRLTGTKIGCGVGGCGACTVMVSNSLCYEYSRIAGD